VFSNNDFYSDVSVRYEPNLDAVSITSGSRSQNRNAVASGHTNPLTYLVADRRYRVSVLTSAPRTDSIQDSPCKVAKKISNHFALSRNRMPPLTSIGGPSVVTGVLPTSYRLSKTFSTAPKISSRRFNLRETNASRVKYE